ncbi:restriction endonuclease subunit S [Acetobacter ghanensis]|uniref:restriction endonuclease subunit S n=1 Tax=Acetobacter ghanensis TaxID=431306 RepID=UPI003D335CDC
MNSMNLSSLLTFTRDGEWGQNKAGPGLVEMRVIRGTDFKNIQIGDISTLPVRYIPENAASRKILQPNDILFETAGGTKDQPTGRSVFLPKKIFSLSKIPLICASFSRFLRVDSEKINPYFLYLYLNYIYNERIIYKYHVQHTGVARFQFTQFVKEQNIPIFNTHQQRAISSIFSVLDDKIDLNRRTNETLEAMARALFRDWFVDFGPTRAKMSAEAPYLAPELWELFPDRLDDEGKPEGWKICNFDELVSINPKEPLSRNTIAPYLSMSELPTQGCLTEAPIPRPFSGGSKFRNEDTLFARITPCLENGKTALAQNLENNIVGWGSTEFHVLRGKGNVPFSWVYLMARDNEFRANAIRGMTGTSGRQRVASEVLATYKTVTPSGNQIWKAFDHACNPLFEKIIINGAESRTLAQLRDLLLPKLMSGEISIRDAEKMVEDAT